MNTDKVITVFGSGHAEPGDDLYELAYSVGRVLGQAGYTLANGGYGGTMRASAQGATEVGTSVIGVTCRAFKRSRPNEFITDECRTESLERRLETLVKLGDAYIVLPGGTGTLLELARVWEFAHKGLTDRDKPIVLVGPFWQSLVDLMVLQEARCSRCLTLVENAEALPSCLGERL